MTDTDGEGFGRAPASEVRGAPTVPEESPAPSKRRWRRPGLPTLILLGAAAAIVVLGALAGNGHWYLHTDGHAGSIKPIEKSPTPAPIVNVPAATPAATTPTPPTPTQSTATTTAPTPAQPAAPVTLSTAAPEPLDNITGVIAKNQALDAENKNLRAEIDKLHARQATKPAVTTAPAAKPATKEDPTTPECHCWNHAVVVIPDEIPDDLRQALREYKQVKTADPSEIPRELLDRLMQLHPRPQWK